MGSLYFDAKFNGEAITYGVNKIEKAFKELGYSAETEGKKIDNAFKKQIYEGSQAVNGLTESIIQQRKSVREATKDVNVLNEAYKRAGRDTDAGKSLFISLTDARISLKKEKDALFDLQTQQAQARLSVRKLKDEYSLYQKEGQNVVESNEKMALSFKKTLAAIGGVAAIKQFVSEVLKVRGQFQQLDVAFTTLLQSKEKANALMAQMVETAAKTPFNLTELATGAKQLVAYGFASEGVNDALIRLGNIAAGLGLPLERLTYLYGTTMTQGRLYTRDLMQFTTSGIPMLQGLADMFGVSTDKVNEMVTAGKIGFPEVQKVIENMTNEGGKFFNLMEEQSKTITGKISNLGDAWDEMLNKIGQSQEGVINGSIDGLKYLIENYEQIGKIIISLIEVYGVYRTACIAHIVLTQSLATTQIMLGATMAKLRSSFIALTASMNLNPLVLVATAIIGLGVVMWNLADHTDAATKAQNKLNDELDKFKQKEEERKQKIESLIRTIQDETETEYAKIKAYEELQKLSPALTEAYSREKLAIASLTDTTKELNAERDNNNYDEIISQIKKYSKYLDDLQKIEGGWSSATFNTSSLQREYSGKSVSGARELAQADLKEWQDILSEYKRIKKEAEENNKPVEVKLLEAQSNRDQIVQEYAAAKFTLEEEQRKIKESGFGVIPIDVQIRFDNAKAQLANIGATISSLLQGKSTQTYKEAYDTAKREWKVAQKALEESKKKSKAEYVAAKKDLDEKEKNFKDLGGITNTTKQDKAAEKLKKEQEAIREQKDKNVQLEKKQSLDRQRQQQDLENQAAQAEIDALENGFDKKDKQRKLNNKKEIQALERQKEDYINAVIQLAKDKFDAEEELNAKQKKGYVKKTFDPSTVKVDTSAFDGIIGNTSKKQLNDKIREQEDSWNEYLIKFGNYQQKRAAIIEKYDNLIKNAEDAGKAATYEKDKQNAVDDLDNSIKNSTTLMGQLFADASQKSASEIQKVIEKAELLMQYLGAVKDEKGNAQIGGKTVSKKDILGLGVSDNTLKNLELSTEQVESLRNAIDKLKGDLGSKSPFKLFETQISEAINKINQGGIKNISQGISVIGEAVSSFSPAVSQFGKDLGNIVGSDDLGNKISGIADAIGGLGTTAMGVGQIMSGDIVGGVMSAVSGISSVVSALDGLFGADYSRYNEMKEQYETISSIWDELIDKKTEYLEMGTTQERKRNEEEILDLIGKQEQAARNLGKERLNSGASTGSHSIGIRTRKDMSKEGWSQWDEFAKSIGMNPNAIGDRMTGLFDLTSKQLEDLKESAPDFWAKLDDDVCQYLEDIIKCGDQTEETIEKAQELWTGISFDSLVDNFKSALSNMDSSAEDFADDFQQYLMNAMIDSFVNGEEFQKKLRGWYDKFAEYSKSNGGLTDDEKDELKTDWDKFVQEGIDYRNDLFESMGFDNTSSSSQSSTQKGFTAMSQDTGEELNGRFTALQISNEEIKNSMLAMLSGVNLISTTSANNGITLMEIRNVAMSSNSYLGDIAGFQKKIYENFGRKLDSMEGTFKQFNSKRY